MPCCVAPGITWHDSQSLAALFRLSPGEAIGAVVSQQTDKPEFTAAVCCMNRVVQDRLNTMAIEPLSFVFRFPLLEGIGNEE